MAGFDPDAYLAEKTAATPAQPAFDPDSYLAAKQVTAAQETPVAASAAAGAISSIPFAGQLGAAGKTAMDVITGVTPPSDAVSEYRRERDTLKGDLGAKEGAHPYAAMAGGLAGMTALPLGAGAESMAAYGGANSLSNSKADLTKGEVGPALDDTLKGGAIGGVIGGAAETALPLVQQGLGKVSQPIADYLAKKAATMRVQATKIPGVTAFNKLKGNAADVLKDYVGFGDTQGDIAKKLSAGFDDANETLADSRQAITNAGGGISQADIIASIRDRAKKLSGIDASQPVADQLNAQADALEQKYMPKVSTDAEAPDATDIDPNPMVSMTDLGKNKSLYADQASASFGNPLDQNKAKELAGIYKGAEEDAASGVGGDLEDSFKQSRQDSSDLNQLAKLSGKKASVYSQGPALNLHALRPGAIGAALGGEEGYRHGGLAGAAAGAAVGAIAGPRALSSASVGADFVSNLVQKAPEALGKWAPTLTAAAARGGSAVGATDFLLQQTDPEYQKHIENLKKTQDAVQENQ